MKRKIKQIVFSVLTVLFLYGTLSFSISYFVIKDNNFNDLVKQGYANKGIYLTTEQAKSLSESSQNAVLGGMIIGLIITILIGYKTFSLFRPVKIAEQE